MSSYTTFLSSGNIYSFTSYNKCSQNFCQNFSDCLQSFFIFTLPTVLHSTFYQSCIYGLRNLNMTSSNILSRLHDGDYFIIGASLRTTLLFYHKYFLELRTPGTTAESFRMVSYRFKLWSYAKRGL